MIDKPLYGNPLAGGLMKDGILQPMRMDDQGQNPELINPRPPTSGGFVTDMRDRTLQDPYEIGGGGMLGVQKIDGSGGGALFLPDENRPRSEEDIRNRYEQARAQAAEQRRNGFLGQVVLPGEMKYEDFKNMNNSFFLKRNPNIPESAYSNFDLTNIGGFDNPTDDASMKGLPEKNEPPMFATPGLPPQQEEIPGARDLIRTVKGPEDTLMGIEKLQRQNQNPYQNNNNNMSNFKNMEKLLQNIDGGIQSLIDNSSYMQNNNNLSQFPFSNSSSPNFMGGDILKWSSYK